MNDLREMIYNIDDEQLRAKFIELYEGSIAIDDLDARAQWLTDQMLELGLVERT